MRHAIFIVNLLQDVNIVRPLAYLAAHELGRTVAFLVSDKFLDRDTTQQLGTRAADHRGRHQRRDLRLRQRIQGLRLPAG